MSPRRPPTRRASRKLSAAQRAQTAPGKTGADGGRETALQAAVRDWHSARLESSSPQQQPRPAAIPPPREIPRTPMRSRDQRPCLPRQSQRHRLPQSNLKPAWESVGMFRTMQKHTRPAARLSERGHYVRAPHLSRRALTATAWSLNMHQVRHTMTVWDQAARAIQYGYRRWILTSNWRERNHAALYIQSHVRRRQVQLLMTARQLAACVCQRYFPADTWRRSVRSENFGL